VTIVVAGRAATTTAGSTGDDLAAARARVSDLAAGGLSRAAAAKQVAAETGLPRRALYEPT
jgi:hypothetical protein